MKRRIVICGGGVAGLVAAYLISRKELGAEVFLIEKTDAVGGLLKTFDYGSNLEFDCGMHFWTETGIAELDAEFRALLPEHEWLVLQGAKRDCAGLYYRGRLQLNSQYPDLRFLPQSEYQACLENFSAHVDDSCKTEHEISECDDVQSYLRNRFGRLIADRYIAPILEKVHGQSAANLSVMSRLLPLTDRVILYDADRFQPMMASDVLRSKIAYPDQRELPLKYASTKSSLYPKKYGIGRVVEALVQKLRSNGVTIMTNSAVTRIQHGTREIESVSINTYDGITQLNDIDEFVWASSSLFLAPLLGIDTAKYCFDPPRKTALVNIMLPEAPGLGDLYCLFVGDPPYSTYRVTNYSAFCPDVAKAGTYPITAEMILAPEEVQDREQLCRRGVTEMRAIGVIGAETRPTFVTAELLAGGFPTVSRRNIDAVERVCTEIKEMQFENLKMVGVLSEPELFFQNEIIVDVYRKVSDLPSRR